MLRLRELRKNCEMTMKELGTEMGVAESTISQYETGKRQPDYEMLLKLGEFFGVSVDYLLGVETEKAHPQHEDGQLEDLEIRAAFFRGADPNITEEEMEEMWQDVKQYFKFKMEQRRNKQKDE